MKLRSLNGKAYYIPMNKYEDTWIILNKLIMGNKTNIIKVYSL